MSSIQSELSKQIDTPVSLMDFIENNQVREFVTKNKERSYLETSDKEELESWSKDLDALLQVFSQEDKQERKLVVQIKKVVLEFLKKENAKRLVRKIEIILTKVERDKDKLRTERIYISVVEDVSSNFRNVLDTFEKNEVSIKDMEQLNEMIIRGALPKSERLLGLFELNLNRLSFLVNNMQQKLRDSDLWPLKKRPIEEILIEANYEGIVRYVNEKENTVRVDIFDENGKRINDVFPISLFKGKKPEVDDDVKYHTWQLKTGQYGGYFEVVGYVPTEMPEEDRKKVEGILKKWEQELNE